MTYIVMAPCFPTKAKVSYTILHHEYTSNDTGNSSGLCSKVYKYRRDPLSPNPQTDHTLFMLTAFPHGCRGAVPARYFDPKHYLCLQLFQPIHVYISIYIYIRICTCTYGMYACTYVTTVWMYVCMHACLHCMYKCMY